MGKHINALLKAKTLDVVYVPMVKCPQTGKLRTRDGYCKRKCNYRAGRHGDKVFCRYSD